MKKALCIISGGMDSTLCAYMAKEMGYEIVGLHFDYDQRTMKKERECFLKICEKLNVKEKIILDASFIKTIGFNALTDTTIPVPKDSISSNKEKKVPISYVPFRNGIFLSIAAAVAETKKCEAIFIGLIEVDGSGYPDCTDKFVQKMQEAINVGRACPPLRIMAPLLNFNKAKIVAKSLELGVPLEYTWSCYEQEEKACGHCDSCLLRLRGFREAGAKDKIAYLEI